MNFSQSRLSNAWWFFLWHFADVCRYSETIFWQVAVTLRMTDFFYHCGWQVVFDDESVWVTECVRTLTMLIRFVFNHDKHVTTTSFKRFERLFFKLTVFFLSSIYQHRNPSCGSKVVFIVCGLILLKENSHLHGLHVVNYSNTRWKSFHNRVPPLSLNYYIVGMMWNLMTKSDHDHVAYHSVEVYLYDSKDKSWQASRLIILDKRMKHA